MVFGEIFCKAYRGSRKNEITDVNILLQYGVSLDSGGDMDIIVASDKEVKVGAVREAFQQTFGKATVRYAAKLHFFTFTL